jgi:hypothetical protein
MRGGRRNGRIIAQARAGQLVHRGNMSLSLAYWPSDEGRRATDSSSLTVCDEKGACAKRCPSRAPGSKFPVFVGGVDRLLT